jgi:hypothetical protein
MPINRQIASGGTPFDVSNALFKMGDGQRQDRAVQVAEERNALVDRRWQAQDAQQQAALAKEAERETLIESLADQFDEAYKAEDHDRADTFRSQLARLDPGYAQQVNQMFPRPKPQPGPIQIQKLSDGATFYTQDGERIGSRMPQAPQQVAPTAEERNWRLRQSLTPEQRAEFDKLYGKGGSGGSKPLPTSALRIVDEANQAIAASAESKALVDAAIAKLEGGQVKLGAAENLKSRGKNWAGKSDDNSRAYADVQQTFEKLRNNYMLLAKGVQTEGDAQRAWASEIGEFVQNDNALALQQMKKAQGMVDRAIAAQEARVDTVYSNFGSERPEAGGGDNDPLGIRR